MERPRLISKGRCSLRIDPFSGSVHLLTKSFAFIDEDDLMEKLKHEADDGVDNEDNKSDDDSNTTEMKTTRSNSDGEISSLVAEGGPMGIIGWGGR
ncbi:hypothetical protein DY000_02048829 [Brassica cretica]|uniref:Uncharacterized protein n=2 Tax=Brassica cretica TaxID=69181 RepID=A0ABQ7F7K5_BRACR|nr:hypothetical protein DY000_02048829 [Brassica cretica]